MRRTTDGLDGNGKTPDTIQDIGATPRTPTASRPSVPQLSRILGKALGVCAVIWVSAILLMLMVWSLLQVYFLLF